MCGTAWHIWRDFCTGTRIPYLVITDDGQLVWMADGYTTSLSHPYSATLPVAGLDDGANYMRNAVKATVDAYTGKVTFYVFDPTDPIIQAYEHLFPNSSGLLPKCLPTFAAMHAIPKISFRLRRKPTACFTCVILQVFYNKEDIWEIAHTNASGQAIRRTMSAHLRCGHFAWREAARIPADPSFHSAGQRQLDRVDGRPL